MKRLLALCLLSACGFPGWEVELDGPYDGVSLAPEALPECANITGWSAYNRWHAGTTCIHCPREAEPCWSMGGDGLVSTCLKNEWMCDGLPNGVTQ